MLASLRPLVGFGRRVAHTWRERRAGRGLHPAWPLLLESVVRELKPVPGAPASSVQDARAANEAMTLPTPVAWRMTVEQGVVGGVPGRWLRLKGREPRGTLLWLHGGAYAVGSSFTHVDMAGRAALAAGCQAFIPDYRLAPEHPAPAAIDDAVAVYLGLLEDTAPERILVAGDSAGGGLALLLMVRVRQGGHPLPRAAALLSPWVDLGDISGSGNQRYDWLVAEHTAARRFAGDIALTDPRISPLYADLSGLPPCLVEMGTLELLLSQDRALVQRLQDAGVQVTAREWEHMVHDGYLFTTVSAEARERLREVGRFLGERL